MMKDKPVGREGYPWQRAALRRGSLCLGHNHHNYATDDDDDDGNCAINNDDDDDEDALVSLPSIFSLSEQESIKVWAITERQESVVT